MRNRFRTTVEPKERASWSETNPHYRMMQKQKLEMICLTSSKPTVPWKKTYYKNENAVHSIRTLNEIFVMDMKNLVAEIKPKSEHIAFNEAVHFGKGDVLLIDWLVNIVNRTEGFL